MAQCLLDLEELGMYCIVYDCTESDFERTQSAVGKNE